MRTQYRNSRPVSFLFTQALKWAGITQKVYQFAIGLAVVAVVCAVLGWLLTSPTLDSIFFGLACLEAISAIVYFLCDWRTRFWQRRSLSLGITLF